MDYKTMKIEEIAQWCKDNGEGKWLLAKLEETKEIDIYPVGDNGKVDRKAKPIGSKVVPLGYFDIKRAFCEKFMPDLLPKKVGGALSMADKVKAILGVK